MFHRLRAAHTFQLTTCSGYNRLTGHVTPVKVQVQGPSHFIDEEMLDSLLPITLLGLQYNSASKGVGFPLRQSTAHLPPLPKSVRTNPAPPFPPSPSTCKSLLQIPATSTRRWGSSPGQPPLGPWLSCRRTESPCCCGRGHR